MKLTILGSGGCMVIPKPLCDCRVCKEARVKGIPYERSGPSSFIHNENLLIDTPADISRQLNNASIEEINSLMFTHLDPDHIEGFRVVEQISLDFRSWSAYPEKQIQLVLPESLYEGLRKIHSVYGPLLDFYEEQGFVRKKIFNGHTRLGHMDITAIPVDRGSDPSFIYVFEREGKKLVYATCDIKPFPENRKEVDRPDLLIIQPGIFEKGLKHDFIYPARHISRKTLYTFEETLAIAHRIKAGHVLFVHLEEYWNRSFDDYLSIEKKHKNISFAYDGALVKV